MEEPIQETVEKKIVGVKFKKQGKTYTFHAGDLELNLNDKVIVETDNGRTIAVISTAVRRAAPTGFRQISRMLSGR